MGSSETPQAIESPSQRIDQGVSDQKRPHVHTARPPISFSIIITRKSNPHITKLAYEQHVQVAQGRKAYRYRRRRGAWGGVSSLRLG